MLVVAVSLLVLDAIATTYLIGHHRRRRRERQALASTARPADWTVRAHEANVDLARRQAVLKERRMAPPVGSARGTSAPSAWGEELRWAAELLAAAPDLVYDPRVWEA